MSFQADTPLAGQCLLPFRVKILFSQTSAPQAEKSLLSQLLPNDYATALEAVDAANKFILDGGYALGDILWEILDLRGHPDDP